MEETLEAMRLDRKFEDESFNLMIAEMKAGLKSSVPMLALGSGFAICLVARHFFPSRLWLWVELPILAMLFIAMGIDIVTDIRKQRSLGGRLKEIGVFVFGGLLIMCLIFLWNHVTVK